MKASYVLTLAAIGLWFVAGSTVFGIPPIPRDEGVHVDVQPKGVHVTTPGMHLGETTGMARATDLIGVKVYNGSNEKLGKIENLVLDASTGTIRYAVLSFDGTLGFGAKLLAVPWGQLKMIPKETASVGVQEPEQFVLEISTDELRNAPGFEKDRWPNFADRKWSMETEKYFNTHRPARRAAREPERVR